MIANPEKPISIYKIAGLVGYAFPMAVTITEIRPYDCDSVHIFSKKGQGGKDQKGHFC